MSKFQHVTDFSDTKHTLHNSPQNVVVLALSLILLTLIPLHFFGNLCSSLQCQSINLIGLSSIQMEKKCDVFRGNWVPYLDQPYYTNETCDLMYYHQNCIKLGRNDTEFLKWRWQPDECELPLFNATQFLELVKGQSIAFVGDSVGRNQMQSLLCLLSDVAYPEDITKNYTSDSNFVRYLYADYNLTIAMFWAPYLVETRDVDQGYHSPNSLMNLYLDRVAQGWASQVELFDYVIISAGQWFFRPVMYYENGEVIGCHGCTINNITTYDQYYGYRKAFRTAFESLLSLKRYKGVTFLRTFSPAHFENGDWNKGGNCIRTLPFTREQIKLDSYNLDFYNTQVEELREAQKTGRKRGLKFRILDTTEAMLRRPDAHPNFYGGLTNDNVSVADCVHWCMPGPIDTWNEFLIYMLKMDHPKQFKDKMQKNA